MYASTLFGGKCKLIFRRLFAAVPIKYERSAFRSRLFCLGLHFWFMQILLVSPWLQLQFQTSDSKPTTVFPALHIKDSQEHFRQRLDFELAAKGMAEGVGWLRV